MKNFFLNKFCIYLLLIPFDIVAQEWIEMSGYNSVGRHHPITVANNNYGYMITGQSASFSNNLDDVFKYNPLTDEWTQISSFPGTARGYAYGVCYDNDAYCGFGSDNFGYPTDWWRFDMETEQWTQLASFPGDGRNHPAMVYAGNKVFVGLGSNLNGNLNDWWEYDISNNVWQELNSFIGLPRHHPFYFGIDNKVYVGFGHGDDVLSQLNIFNDFYVWDLTTQTWSQLNNFPGEGRVAGTQFSINGKGYILSGDGEDHAELDYGEFWEYNPDNDSWTELEPHPGGARWAPGTFIIGCDVYLTSGLVGATANFPSDLYKFQINDSCGCLDQNAFNYSSTATIDDGNCCYNAGCTDENAFNYSPEACYDDNSCVAINLGCTDPNYSDFDIHANLEIFTGGPADLSDYGTGGYHYNDSWDMVFNVSEDTYLSTIELNAQNPGEITIDIGLLNGNIISQFDVSLTSGWNLIELNTLLQEGNNYTIGVTGNNENLGIYRNDAVPLGVFPIEIADRITIVGNTTDSPESFYYYFYNWTLDASCSGTLSTGYQQPDKFIIYPNPVSDYLIIKEDDKLNTSCTINLINTVGNIVYRSNFQVNQPISVSNFDSGIYFLEIYSEDLIFREKIYIN